MLVKTTITKSLLTAIRRKPSPTTVSLSTTQEIRTKILHWALGFAGHTPVHGTIAWTISAFVTLLMIEVIAAAIANADNIRRMPRLQHRTTQDGANLSRFHHNLWQLRVLLSPILPLSLTRQLPVLIRVQ